MAKAQEKPEKTIREEALEGLPEDKKQWTREDNMTFAKRRADRSSIGKIRKQTEEI